MLVEREDFIKTLTQLKPALGIGGVAPQLAHVWFDKTAAYAYDGGFGIKLAYKGELECGVPGIPLLGLLNTSALKEATLEPNGSAALQIKLGKSHSKLAVLEADQKVWPFPIKLPRNATVLQLDEEFIEGLRKTLFIKASPATRVEHHGVVLQRSKADLELYSTDSSTMVRVSVKGAAKGVEFERVLLPRDFAEQLVAQAPGGAKLYILTDCLIADADGISFYSNLLDLSGADDMGAIVAKNVSKHPPAVALPAGLESTLARAEILAGAEEPVVAVSVEGNALKLAGTYALGALQESLSLEGKHPEASMKLRAGLLRRALVHAETFSVTEKCLLLRGGTDFVYLVASL